MASQSLLVIPSGARDLLVIPFGREFWKMSGSGNDFVFLDARDGMPELFTSPDVVAHICKRGTGIGADGIVFLQRSDKATVGLLYLNADGSRADLCGNATLCTARLARELGVVKGSELTIETDVGVLGARFLHDRAEIDLPSVQLVRTEAGIPLEHGEKRIGFAIAGVPHLTLLVDDIHTVDVVGRGRPLRHHRTLQAGANVNFVQLAGEGIFAYRTYERGVEAETLACGTGAVATAVLLASWGLAKSPVRIRTRSGKELRVRLSGAADKPRPSLSGEARIVYRGAFGELDALTDLRELQLGQR